MKKGNPRHSICTEHQRLVPVKDAQERVDKARAKVLVIKDKRTGGEKIVTARM
jgi:hypothetical protein